MLRQLWQITTQLNKQLSPTRCQLCRLPCPSGSDNLCPWCYRDLPRMSQWLCRGCGLAITEPEPLCGACLHHPPPWSQVYSVLEFTPISQALLHRLKYQHQSGIARVLAGLLAGEILDGNMLEKKADQAPLHLVAMPLTPWRQATRGYNQAELISRELARHLNLPQIRRQLKRQGRHISQSQLDARARQSNLANAFYWHGSPCPARIALVDDVITTGATCRAAGEVLRQNGCRELQIWTPIRTEKKPN